MEQLRLFYPTWSTASRNARQGYALAMLKLILAPLALALLSAPLAAQ